MAFAATALMGGIRRRSCACVSLYVCCVFARAFSRVFLSVIYVRVPVGALRFTAPLNPIQKRGQRWKVNSGRTLAEVQRGQRGVFRGASEGGVHGAEAGSLR